MFLRPRDMLQCLLVLWMKEFSNFILLKRNFTWFEIIERRKEIKSNYFIVCLEKHKKSISIHLLLHPQQDNNEKYCLRNLIFLNKHNAHIKMRYFLWCISHSHFNLNKYSMLLYHIYFIINLRMLMLYDSEIKRIPFSMTHGC